VGSISVISPNPSAKKKTFTPSGHAGVKVSTVRYNLKMLDALIYKSLGFVCVVMRVAVTMPVKEVTTLFVSGASSVNVPEK
jgi:hypothetical protein